jgi:hypothetical protein
MQMMERKAYYHRFLLLLSGTLALLIALALPAVSPAMTGETADQKSFASPQQAVTALVKAVRNDDDAELIAILGPGSEDLVSSGDEVADRNGRKRFLKAYEKKNSLEREEDARSILLLGDKDYPFPIPIVRQGESWIFDTRSGRVEILNRRIGRNELHTIEVMQAYTDAQREYAARVRNDEGGKFARKFASSEGKKDGLYWEAAEDEEESPFGPLIARAAEEGYTDELDGNLPDPFHGYYFKILQAQGKHAEGGAFDYVVNGRMILGFALVAWPARYGITGITTFIVNQEGMIYEKDLGEDTAKKAAAMTVFDPDDSWHEYEEPAEP